jgi:hypothetical protein
MEQPGLSSLSFQFLVFFYQLFVQNYFQNLNGGILFRALSGFFLWTQYDFA